MKNCNECGDLTCPHRSQSSAGGKCYYWSDEQANRLLIDTANATLDYINLRQFRRECAKDILCALCSYPPLGIVPDVVNQAINIADELIKQLKETEK